MIIKIRSQNRYFLDILHKNPNTDLGLYFKELKNGVIVGNAVSDSEYNCIFQDTKYSYLPEDSNQIDFQSYCAPLVAINMITEFFNHLVKDSEELKSSKITWLDKTYDEVDTENCIIEIPTIYQDSGWYRDGKFLLGKYVSGIEMTHKVGNNYTLKLTANNVREAINKLALLSLFLHITNRYGIFTFLSDDFIQKYITILTNIQGIPYFVFYLFIKRVIRSPKQFETYKPQLEAYFNGRVQFVFTDTHNSRKAFICNQIDFRQPVLDFGCGELQYFKKLRGKGFKEKYIAYDIENMSELVDKMIEQEKSFNLIWEENLENLKGFKGQIILSEVIEHNSIEEAKNILIWLRDNTEFTKLYVTTPNSEFNQNYEMTEEFRHDDHHFELSRTEFEDLIKSIFNAKISFYGVGDCVDGNFPTSAAIIESITE